jgi:pectate lyase
LDKRWIILTDQYPIEGDFGTTLGCGTPLAIDTQDDTAYYLSSTGIRAIKGAVTIKTLGFPKTLAFSFANARTMYADNTNMVGYAANAGTTGGSGKSEFWVTNASDDVNFVGSFRWAITQALAAGGGNVIADPEAGLIDVALAKALIIGQSAVNTLNITVDAPGRNLIIRNMPKVEGIRISGENIIFRRVRITNLPDIYVDGEEKDGLSIAPLYSDKIWIDECELGHVSDGVGDCASSALVSEVVTITIASPGIVTLNAHGMAADQKIVFETTGALPTGLVAGTTYFVSAPTANTFQVAATAGGAAINTTGTQSGVHMVRTTLTASGLCRLTMTHNIIRNQDKCLLLGKTGITAGNLSSTNYRVLATYFENWFHASTQRMPLAQLYAFADCANNVIDFAPYQRQDGTAGACSGMIARWGGAIDSRGDLFRSLSGTGYVGVGTTATNGAYRTTGDAFEDSITGTSANTGFIPAIPYTLAAAAIPAAGADRDTWANSIIAKCGPGLTPFPPDAFQFHPGVPAGVSNGRNLFIWGDGYYEQIGYMSDHALTVNPVSGDMSRQPTKTIVAGVINVTSTEHYFAVEGEGSVSDDLTNITGGADGMWFGFRCADAAHVITVRTTGNIDTPADIILDDVGKTLWCIYDTGSAKWAISSSPPQSGVYTPTATAIVNVSAIGTVSGMWSKNNDIVTVSGNVSITPTAAASADTQISLTLPLASNLITIADLNGTSCSDDAVTQVIGAVKAGTALDVAVLRFKASTTSARNHSFIFQYIVK